MMRALIHMRSWQWNRSCRIKCPSTDWCSFTEIWCTCETSKLVESVRNPFGPNCVLKCMDVWGIIPQRITHNALRLRLLWTEYHNCGIRTVCQVLMQSCFLGIWWIFYPSVCPSIHHTSIQPFICLNHHPSCIIPYIISLSISFPLHTSIQQ